MTDFDINEQIIKAIDIIVNKRMSELEFDKTIQATIVKQSTTNPNLYYVKYGDAVFAAYGEPIYEVSSTPMYVLIPKNDFSLRKTIVGPVDESEYTKSLIKVKEVITSNLDEAAASLSDLVDQTRNDLAQAQTDISAFKTDTNSIFSSLQRETANLQEALVPIKEEIDAIKIDLINEDIINDTFNTLLSENLNLGDFYFKFDVNNGLSFKKR